MAFYIYKGARPSNGAIALKNAIQATMIRAEGGAFSGRAGSVLINWGTHSDETRRLEAICDRRERTFLNRPDNVALATRKDRFFERMARDCADIMIPYATDWAGAYALVEAGGRVFARTTLNGHSGDGIQLVVSNRDHELQVVQQLVRTGNYPVHIAETRIGAPAAIQNCRLFTQGITGKRTEFRIHVVRGQVILVQAKLRREGAAEQPGYNSIIRNVGSGWIYAVNNVPEAGRGAAEQAALRAVAACGLDFGAVDVVWKEDTDRAYVLEINTAPGLDEEGSALTNYSEAFRNVQ